MKFLQKLNNFYALIIAVVLFWVIFVDVNNIPTQIGNAIELHQLEKEKEFYVAEKKKLEDEQKKSLSTQKDLERHAREKYYMKKDSEDVFVLIDEKGELLER